jgi:hypothetical protein
MKLISLLFLIASFLALASSASTTAQKVSDGASPGDETYLRGGPQDEVNGRELGGRYYYYYDKSSKSGKGKGKGGKSSKSSSGGYYYYYGGCGGHRGPCHHGGRARRYHHHGGKVGYRYRHYNRGDW